MNLSPYFIKGIVCHRKTPARSAPDQGRSAGLGWTHLACVLAGLALAGNHPVLAADEVTRVFLFAGQSNMEAADTKPNQIDNDPMFKGAGAPQPDVLFSYLIGRGPVASKGWVALRPLDSFGPELTFARLVKKQVSFPIAIIKSAVGGTTAAYDWSPDAPDSGMKLYPKTLSLIRESLAELDRRGIHYRLEGVMWHQGENDMLDRSLAPHYAENLAKIIRQLRQDLNAPKLKWYLAEVSEQGIWGMDNRGNLAILRQQQQQAMDADPLLRWVPTSHLAFEVMNSGQPHYHFGTQGQLQMGEAFAAAYLADLGKPMPTPVRSFTTGLPLAKAARVRLFVLAGQRNMEAEDSFVSAISQFPQFASLDQDQERVLYRYSLGGGVKVASGWEPLGPVGYLGTFGPELSFCAYLRKSIEAKDGIAIVKFTHSGAQSPDWFPQGSPESRRNLYPKFLAFVRAAIQDLTRQGYDCRLEGIFWHTGENDTYYRPYAQNYAKSMKQLMDQTRSDFNQPGLRWFISEQPKDAIWRNMELVNTALKTLAQSDPHLLMIETSQLPHGRLHFEAQGTLLLGEAMAKAYLQVSRADEGAPGQLVK